MREVEGGCHKKRGGGGYFGSHWLNVHSKCRRDSSRFEGPVPESFECIKSMIVYYESNK